MRAWKCNNISCGDHHFGGIFHSNMTQSERSALLVVKEIKGERESRAKFGACLVQSEGIVIWRVRRT